MDTPVRLDASVLAGGIIFLSSVAVTCIVSRDWPCRRRSSMPARAALGTFVATNGAFHLVVVLARILPVVARYLTVLHAVGAVTVFLAACVLLLRRTQRRVTRETRSLPPSIAVAALLAAVPECRHRRQAEEALQRLEHNTNAASASWHRLQSELMAS